MGLTVSRKIPIVKPLVVKIINYENYSEKYNGHQNKPSHY